ncbi:hypothetical protein NKR23_g5453 [Pleurostoma richardsiae]|uniref:Uncharacterized protein n=1 Tax=Pleurostoma richardsiae TaxID=41990 RepID=A0AA38RFW5_9PEZI|nr:hypothetical protein NKR23_g5453 [Pleurostoma richardsiae]
MRVLLQSGADIQAADFTGRTQLHIAARQGRYEAMALLLEKGADENAEDHLRRSPLHDAVAGKNARAVRVLLLANADINQGNEIGSAPLHFAVKDLEVMKELCNWNADLDRLDMMGRTPLHIAVAESCSEVAACLLREGTDPYRFGLSPSRPSTTRSNRTTERWWVSSSGTASM